MTVQYWGRTSDATGDMHGDGLEKLLGKTSLDRFELLVRESCQNSWDARQSDDVPVEVAINLRTLSGKQHDALRQQIFADIPRHLLDNLPRLSESLSGKDFRVLTITDRGTTGLGGPSRANEVRETMDFANLVFNVGAHRDNPLRGGTHGFGKMVAFYASASKTIIIHSFSKDENNQPIERLIVSAITPTYVSDGVQYVGRHWWGKLVNERPEPVIGEEARALADALGLPTLSANSMGTTIAVLDPILIDADEGKTALHLRDSLLRHLWPKMIPLSEGDNPPMMISLEASGQKVPIPDPKAVYPYSALVEALQVVRGLQGRSKDPRNPLVITRSVERQRAVGGQDLKLLGHIGIIPAGRKTASLATGSDTEVAHHVALMRAPELVVEYRKGPIPSSNEQGWLGVFVCNPDIDLHFAAAEPATHDRWDPTDPSWHPGTEADKIAKSNVSVALTRIQEIVSEVMGTRGVGATVAVTGTGVVAHHLAGLVSAPDGGGSGPPSKRTGGAGGSRKGGKKKSRTSQISSSLTEENAKLIRKVEWKSENESADSVMLGIAIDVLTADGRPEGSEVGGDLPKIISFRVEGAETNPTGFSLAARSSVTVEVAIEQPLDTAIAARLEELK